MHAFNFPGARATHMRKAGLHGYSGYSCRSFNDNKTLAVAVAVPLTPKAVTNLPWDLLRQHRVWVRG